MQNNIKGLYRLVYGYSDHTHYFILTREQFEKVKELEHDADEKKYFDISISAVKDLFEAAKKIDPSLV